MSQEKIYSLLSRLSILIRKQTRYGDVWTMEEAFIDMDSDVDCLSVAIREYLGQAAQQLLRSDWAKLNFKEEVPAELKLVEDWEVPGPARKNSACRQASPTRAKYSPSCSIGSAFKVLLPQVMELYVYIQQRDLLTILV